MQMQLLMGDGDKKWSWSSSRRQHFQSFLVPWGVFAVVVVAADDVHAIASRQHHIVNAAVEVTVFTMWPLSGERRGSRCRV